MNDCLSGDPYCAKNPRSYGTYERYSGALCGECEEYEIKTHCARCKQWIGEQDESICDTCLDEAEEAMLEARRNV